jgi:xanthine/uracil permease
VILAGLVFLPIAVAVLYWRFAAALSCAVVGTLLLFIGTGLLLLFNGDSAVGHISGAQSLYGWLFLATTAVSTLEQLFLAKTINIAKGAALAKKALHKKAKENEVLQKTANWRSS